MIRFGFVKPASVEEACDLLAKAPGKSCVVAGGTDFMVQVHEKAKRWEGLEYAIDISDLAELKGIRVEGDVVHVGAMTNHTEAQFSEVLNAHGKVLSMACGTVGAPQIRNRGTIGGAIGNASPASDPVPALIALEAQAVVVGPKGKRVVPMSEMITRPGKTALADGEIITEVFFKSVAGMRSTFVKLGRRKALSISRMNVSVVAHQDENGVIDYIRLAPGCVFATPERAGKAEAMLLGKKPDAALLEEAAKAVGDEMVERTGVRWSTEYKQPVIAALVRRALEEVLEVK